MTFFIVDDTDIDIKKVGKVFNFFQLTHKNLTLQKLFLILLKY